MNLHMLPVVCLGFAAISARGMEGSNEHTPLLPSLHSQEEEKEGLAAVSAPLSLKSSFQQITSEASKAIPLAQLVEQRRTEFPQFLATFVIFTKHPNLKQSYEKEGELLFASVATRQRTRKEFDEEYYQVCRRATEATTDLCQDLIKHKERYVRENTSECRYVCLCTIL